MLFRGGLGSCTWGWTVPEPNGDEAIVYKDFFIASLCMPLHPALADILLDFQAHLYQLIPNTTA
jgi:hypothetical protein